MQKLRANTNDVSSGCLCARTCMSFQFHCEAVTDDSWGGWSGQWTMVIVMIANDTESWSVCSPSILFPFLYCCKVIHIEHLDIQWISGEYCNSKFDWLKRRSSEFWRTPHRQRGIPIILLLRCCLIECCCWEGERGNGSMNQSIRWDHWIITSSISWIHSILWCRSVICHRE